MRKLIALEFITRDGVIQAPGSADYVVSRTMRRHDWQPSVFIHGEVSGVIAAQYVRREAASR